MPARLAAIPLRTMMITITFITLIPEYLAEVALPPTARVFYRRADDSCKMADKHCQDGPNKEHGIPADYPYQKFHYRSHW
jgi:hypothetical protein